MRASLAALLDRRLVLAPLLGAALALGWTSWLDAPRPVDWPTRIALGESLLHGLGHGAISETMPASSVLAAVRRNHAPPPVRRELPRLLLALCVLLAFTLGRLLRSNACGVLAAFSVVLFCLGGVLDNAEQALYTLLNLLVAHLLVWRARTPDLRRSVLAGLGIGLSLLVRTPLVLLPLALSAYELFVHRTRPLRTRVKLLLPLWAMPCLLLLPWVYMNARVHGAFIPFERGRAHENVVAGALGLVSTVEGGDIVKLAGLGEGDSVLGWAARETLRHPLRSAGAFLARLWHASLLHPVLCLLLVWSLWLFRKREEHRQLALLLAVYFGSHCLMGILARYFEPVWPVVATLAMAPLARLLEPPERERGEDGMGLAWACLAGAAAFCLSALSLAGVYPQRLDDSPPALDRAVAAHPRDPWLRAERGRRHLARGDAARAARDLSRASALDPHQVYRLEHAWALAAKGGPEAGMIEGIRFEGPVMAQRGHLIRALSRLAQGRDAEAGDSFAAAREAYAGGCGIIWRLGRAEESGDFERRLCSLDRAFEHGLLELLEPFPPDVFASALSRFPAAAAGAASRALAAAQNAAGKDDREQALRQLARVVTADKGNSAAADMYGDLGEHGKALGVLDELVRRRPESASLWSRRAAAALRGGKRGEAARSLARLERLDADAETLRQAASIYGKMKDHRRALRSLDRLVALSPEDAPWWDRAHHALLAGDCAVAAESLAEARKPSVSDRPVGDGTARLDLADRRDRTEGLYGELRSRCATRSDLDALVERFPDDPELWLDRAARARDAGDRETAARSVAKAEGAGLSPGQLERAAGLYRELERHADAARTLGDVLARSPGDAELHVERAYHAARSGDSETALASLERAAALDPGDSPLRRAAAVYLELGEGRRALAILDGLVKRRPKDAGLLMERAAAAAAAGDRALASRSLSAALSLAPPPRLRRRAALLHQRWEEYDRAIELLRPLTSGGELAAAALGDKGVCEHLKGSTDTALKDLEAALRLDPSLLPAALTLGAIHAEAGRSAQALAVYDRALKTPPRKGTQAMRRLILKNRDELLRGPRPSTP